MTRPLAGVVGFLPRVYTSAFAVYQEVASCSAAATRAAPGPLLSRRRRCRAGWRPGPTCSRRGEVVWKEVSPLREMTLSTASPLICCTPMVAWASCCAGREPCPIPARSERAVRKPASSQTALMTSSTEASASPTLSTRLVRRVSHRCARYKTMPVTIASNRAAITCGSRSRACFPPEHGVLLGEDGVRGGQQHKVRLLGGDLEERAAGQRVAERVLAPGPRHVPGVDRQPAAQRGERACRRLAAAGRAQRGQVRARRWRCHWGSAAADERRLGAGQELVGDRHVGVRDRLVDLLASRLSGSSTVASAGGRGVHVATQPPKAPQASESRTRRSAAPAACPGCPGRDGVRGRGSRRGAPGARRRPAAGQFR